MWKRNVKWRKEITAWNEVLLETLIVLTFAWWRNSPSFFSLKINCRLHKNLSVVLILKPLLECLHPSISSILFNSILPAKPVFFQQHFFFPFPDQTCSCIPEMPFGGTFYVDITFLYAVKCSYKNETVVNISGCVGAYKLSVSDLKNVRSYSSWSS